MTKELSRWGKFVEWMKFNPPHALSWDGWDEFKLQFKREASFRYFIMETMPDATGWFFGPLIRAWNATKVFCRYRFIKRHRYHLVDTGLKPDYYEVETQMLYANFSLLVRFVECQKSSIGMAFDPKNFPRPSGWWWRKYTDWRMPEAGLRYLEWEVTLDDGLPKEEQQWDGVSEPSQAQAAREVLVLYKWWVEEHINPNDLEYPESPSETEHKLFSDKYDRTTSEYLSWKSKCDDRDKEEERIRNEETKMLMRLIKIRRRLWT